jgi:hypothetical protein
VKNIIVKGAGLQAAIAIRQRIAAINSVVNSLALVPAFDGGMQHERITAINASLLVEANFSEALTTYARGWRDPDIETALDFYSPLVPVSQRFEYATFANAEEWYSDGSDDDLRGTKGEFKNVEYTSGKVNAKTENRGLRIVLDSDQVRNMPNWEQFYTAKLLRRLKRNSLRRAIALLSAAATNTAKTWDTTAGKDPDQDVMSELVTAADLTGVKPNRVGYGDTSAAKRQLAHRAQNTAGGFASAALTEAQVAAMLGVDSVLFSKSRYTSSATARTQAVGNLVLMFNAASGMDTEDASNIKRFVSNGSPEEGGGRFQVYSARLSAKRHVIAVGHYELTKITSTLGIRKFTVS